MTGPLHGFRIIELAGIGPAPFAGGLLADLGADVVRIERIARPGVAFDLPPRFDFYNRNKRSIALDLKQPAAAQAALRMVARADALIEGFRPGVAERLGLGPDVCLAANPRLVYGRMTGWGQDGPLAQEAGHDINYLALTGALHAIGAADRPPPPPLNVIADLGGGALYLAVGVLAAAIEARASGRGQVVDAAMIDGVSNLMSMFHAFRQLGGWTARRGEDTFSTAARPSIGPMRRATANMSPSAALEPQFYANLIAGARASRAKPCPHRPTAAPGRRCASASRRSSARAAATNGPPRPRAATPASRRCSTSTKCCAASAPFARAQCRRITHFAHARHPSPAPRFGFEQHARRR